MSQDHDLDPKSLQRRRLLQGAAALPLAGLPAWARKSPKVAEVRSEVRAEPRPARPAAQPRARKPRGTGPAKLFVLDTNVLMHDPTSLFRFAEHDVYLPMITLEELDNHKKGMSEVARNARQVSREMDALATEGSLDPAAGIALREGRYFTEQDGATAPPVAIVNEAYLKTFHPNGFTLGFSVLALQAFSELIKRFAFLKGLIPDPTSKGSGKTAEDLSLVEPGFFEQTGYRLRLAAKAPS